MQPDSSEDRVNVGTRGQYGTKGRTDNRDGAAGSKVISPSRYVSTRPVRPAIVKRPSEIGVTRRRAGLKPFLTARPGEFVCPG